MSGFFILTLYITPLWPPSPISIVHFSLVSIYFAHLSLLESKYRTLVADTSARVTRFNMPERELNMLDS